jgi:hypothetical protein
MQLDLMQLELDGGWSRDWSTGAAGAQRRAGSVGTLFAGSEMPFFPCVG